MLYYFSEKPRSLLDSQVSIKAETLEEFDVLKNLPYVRVNKQDDSFKVRFQYLINLKRRFTVQPQDPIQDRDYLEFLVKKIKLLKRLETQVKYEGEFDYSTYLKRDKDFKLKDYQKIGIHYLTKARRCILADDVGLGKTIQAILSICRLIDLKVIRRKIVIVTNASVKYQWKDEILGRVDLDKFPEFKNSICIVEGGRNRRRELYKQNNKIYILNYEQFIRDFGSLVKLSRSVDAVILDEASKIKNTSAKRTQNLKAIFNQIPVKFLLTATPIENKLADLYSLCNFLDSSIFCNKEYFDRNYCTYQRFRLGRFGPMITKLVNYKNLDDAKFKVTGFYLRRTVEMVGEQLPKFLIQLRTVDMLPQQKELYMQVKKLCKKRKIKESTPQVVKDLFRGCKRDVDKTIPAMTIRQTLHAICNDVDMLPLKVIEKSAKTEELCHLLSEELFDQKIIIFSMYRRFVNVLQKKLKKYKPLVIHGGINGKQRNIIKKKFQTSSLHNILIMTSAGEYGLDIPEASVIINMDLPHNPSRLKQRCGRARRISSKHKTIRVINIFAKDSIEEKTVTTIFNKMDLFTKFFNEDTPDLVSGKLLEEKAYKNLRKVA